MPLGAGGLEVLLVHGRGVGIALRRLRVLAGADIDVRRHVHQVSRAGHQRLEPAGLRHRALGRLRRFDRVNVVVIRARMIRIALHHALERATMASVPGSGVPSFVYSRHGRRFIRLSA